MAPQQLAELAKTGDIAAFETRCLEGLETGDLTLTAVAGPLERLGREAERDRVFALGQALLENANLDDDPAATLRVVRTCLMAQPKEESLRQKGVELYKQVYEDTPGIEELLEAAGLDGVRPARLALRVLDLALGLTPGDMLLSRSEERVAEVVDIDTEQRVARLKRGMRRVTVPLLELARDYDPIDPDDFRVLRELRPDRLTELLKSDPTQVVIGLIQSHGGMVTLDQLKQELTPQHVATAQWSKWWTSARNKLKRCKHIVIEGRSPAVLTYSAEGMTLEDEVWDDIRAHRDVDKWLSAIESYLREKKANREEPSADLIQRAHEHILAYVEPIREKRPAESLACGLLLCRMATQTETNPEPAVKLVTSILTSVQDPTDLAEELPGDAFWDELLTQMLACRPGDAHARAVELFPIAPLALLDRIAELAREGGLLAELQVHIDTAVADPVDYPELVYWLLRGPKDQADLELPTPVDLFLLIIQTIRALGLTLNPPEHISRRFKHRMRAALAQRDYARVKEALDAVPAERAVTLRTSLERLEGLGDTVQATLIEQLRERHPLLWRKVVVRPDPWEDPDVLYSTKAGIDRKTEERDDLVNVKMRENAKRIGEAAAMGDLSENSEYKFALEERDLLRARLAQINNELSIAQKIEPHMVSDEHVGIGSHVVLRRTADGGELTLTFLGPFDGDVERGIYNYKAPVSQSLMGLRVGDKATIQLEGRETEIEVLSLSSGLEF